MVLGEPEKQQRVQQLVSPRSRAGGDAFWVDLPSHMRSSILTSQESELSKKRKKCESLEQEARKKQRRCEELVSAQPGGPPGPAPPFPPASQVVGSPQLCFLPSCPENVLFPPICGAPLSWLMQVPGGGERCPLCGERRKVGAGTLPRGPLVSQELQLREAQSENARLVEENSRLGGRAAEKEQVAALPRPCWAPGLQAKGRLPHPPPRTGLE